MSSEKDYEYKQWVSANNKMLIQMFAGTLLKNNPKREITKYFKQLAKIYEQTSNKRQYVLAHSTITDRISRYLEDLGYEVKYEVPLSDMDSSYRFDLASHKGSKNIVVEVKPTVNPRDMGQVWAYNFDLRKKFRKVRVFLGTDILNFDLLYYGGEIEDMILELARYDIGIIFVDRQQAWLIPSEFLLA